MKFKNATEALSPCLDTKYFYERKIYNEWIQKKNYPILEMILSHDK